MSVRRVLTLAAVLVLALTLAACGRSEPEKSLFAQGEDVVDMMAELAKQDAYLDAAASSTAVRDALAGAAVGSYDALDVVYAVTVDADALLSGAAAEDMSEPLAGYLRGKSCAAVINMVNAQAGTEALAAANICAAGKSFVCEGLSQSVLYIYVYRDGVPAAVSFVPGDDGAVSAAGMFILDEGFPVGSAGEVEERLAPYGAAVTVAAGG